MLPSAASAALLLPAGAAGARTTDAVVQRGLQRLVAAPGGPVGAIATLYRNGHTTVLGAGRADAARRGAPRLGDHMRIASVSKAFSGAVALHLVQQGQLGLDDTIRQRLRGMMPAAWSAVTVRELLNHTSGLPDYTQSDRFRERATKDPHGYVSPTKIIDWVRQDRLVFTPGSRYEYSNGAWASGAVVSTPADLGAFMRADLGGRFFGKAQRGEQLQFVRGSSSPAGPGTNSAGLAIFRYTTRCGTVYGHTGNFPGYVQWAAATADGRRSVTTSLNIAAPTGALLQQLRSVQASAVCALLGK